MSDEYREKGKSVKQKQQRKRKKIVSPDNSDTDDDAEWKTTESNVIDITQSRSARNTMRPKRHAAINAIGKQCILCFDLSFVKLIYPWIKGKNRAVLRDTIDYTTEPERLIDCTVKKIFKDGYSYGKVISFNDKKNIFNVKYDSGNEEEEWCPADVIKMLCE